MERVILFDAYEIQADLSTDDTAFHKLDALFRQGGFTVQEGSLFFRMPLSRLSQLPVMKEIKEDREGEVKKLALVSQYERFKFQDHMMQNKALMSELDWDLYDKELSFLGFRGAKAVCGLFISDNGTCVHIKWIYAEKQEDTQYLNRVKELQDMAQKQD